MEDLIGKILFAERDEPPASPAKQAKKGENKNVKEAGQPSRLKCKVTNISPQLIAKMEFEDGETKTVSIAAAREEYTEELLDFLLARMKFKSSPI